MQLGLLHWLLRRWDILVQELIYKILDSLSLLPLPRSQENLEKLMSRTVFTLSKVNAS